MPQVTRNNYQVAKKLQGTCNMVLATSVKPATCSLQLATERSM